MTNGHFEYISIPRCGVMPSVNDNKTDKKKRLLESAFELFLDKSVNSTAVDDVVKGAGVAKGTFYLYFKDKYDLLNQLSVFRVEVLPPQSADFTPPQSCGQLGVEEIVPQFILPNAFHKSVKLFVIEYLLRRIIVFGNRCADRWVFNNQP